MKKLILIALLLTGCNAREQRMRAIYEETCNGVSRRERIQTALSLGDAVVLEYAARIEEECRKIEELRPEWRESGI